MKRGILAIVMTAAAALPAPPAPAAAPSYEVLEITPWWRTGTSYVYLFTVTGADEPGLMSFIQLAPRKGGGWTRTAFAVLLYNGKRTRFQTFGHPSLPVSVGCPGGDSVCGRPGKGDEWLWQVSFKPAPGNRYLVAGPRDRVAAIGPVRVRRSTLGARVVLNDAATGTGGVVAQHRIEAFHSATAPGGKYGSGAFATAPCDTKDGTSAGTATLKSDGSDKAVGITCRPGQYTAFSGTTDGRTWTVAGPVAGEWDFPHRLLVIDYPKR
jgi:hypothetical protein